MPKLSKRSVERLATCHPDLQKLFNELIKEVDFTVLCGHRTKEEQDEAFKIGTSRAQYPQSKHNKFPSLAVDIAPFPIVWSDTKQFSYLATKVKEKAVELGLKIKWGGDFKNLKDMPHYELVGD